MRNHAKERFYNEIIMNKVKDTPYLQENIYKIYIIRTDAQNI